jgi:hypothetical protein
MITIDGSSSNADRKRMAIAKAVRETPIAAKTIGTTVNSKGIDRKLGLFTIAGPMDSPRAKHRHPGAVGGRRLRRLSNVHCRPVNPQLVSPSRPSPRKPPREMPSGGKKLAYCCPKLHGAPDSRFPRGRRRCGKAGWPGRRNPNLHNHPLPIAPPFNQSYIPWSWPPWHKQAILLGYSLFRPHPISIKYYAVRLFCCTVHLKRILSGNSK